MAVVDVETSAVRPPDPRDPLKFSDRRAVDDLPVGELEFISHGRSHLLGSSTRILLQGTVGRDHQVVDSFPFGRVRAAPSPALGGEEPVFEEPQGRPPASTSQPPPAAPARLGLTYLNTLSQ